MRANAIVIRLWPRNVRKQSELKSRLRFRFFGPCGYDRHQSGEAGKGNGYIGNNK